jgi:predicted TIM-barrel fold metal-dependent hydrolase
MRGTAKSYDDLRAYLDTVPVVDCHDHTRECGPHYVDPIHVVTSHPFGASFFSGYFISDLWSVLSDADGAFITDASQPLEARWPVLERAWQRACHTGYAQVTRRVLRHFYQEEDLTLAALQRMQGRLLDLTDRDLFDRVLAEAGIVARLVDVVWPDTAAILRGAYILPPRSRLVIPLPAFHSIRNYAGVQANVSALARRITSLDEYLDACLEIFTRFKAQGAVAFKDQSAYDRTLDYALATRAQAEEVFNWFMADPRRSAAYPDAVQPLSDFLFHAFMRFARDLDLPVQLHTGHMAGIRNEITKTNAVALTKVLELHRDVRFDLFHANWPYAGEILFLVKNYPNAALDFCWANIIDPIYCQGLFRQALSAVPHGKIHAYGSDYFGSVDRAWAHLEIARDNVAIALSDMVALDYLDLDAAKSVAHAWLFDNPNAFFRLGL